MTGGFRKSGAPMTREFRKSGAPVTRAFCAKAPRTARALVGSFLQALLLLVGITFVTFFLLHLSPKNPAEIWLAGTDGNVGQLSEATIRAQEKLMGLDQPLLVQYKDWVIRLFHGDLGVSFTTGRPVAGELLEALAITVPLAFGALAVTAAISIPMGVYCACYKDRFLDHVSRAMSFLGISLPSFFISLLLLWLFCLKLKVFPVIAGSRRAGMVLPMAVLAVQCSARLTRQIRGAVLSELKKDYVAGAYARGASRKQVLFGHVLKNITVPLLAWLSMDLGVLLGGAAIVETVFSLDGLGKLAVEAVTRMDYYMIQGFVLVTALIFLALNFIVDVLSRCVDPRIGREAL